MSRLSVLTTAVCAALLVCAPAAPAHAEVTRPDPGEKMAVESPGGQAYAWNNVAAAPLGDWYSLAGSHAFNSTNPASPHIFAVRTDTGRYVIWVPFRSAHGNAQVTALGAEAFGGAYCKPVRWTAVLDRGQGTDVEVACFNRGGLPTDARFVISYGFPAPGSRSAYVLASQPSTPNYVPDPDYQDGPGYPATVARTTLGAYTVILPSLGAAGGHALVSATGEADTYCTVAEILRSGPDQRVDVRCFVPGGGPADSAFSLAYAEGGVPLGSGSGPAFYLWADEPGAVSYEPAGSYSWYTSPVPAQVSHTVPGRYIVTFPIAMDSGTLRVAARGGSGAQCVVLAWGSRVAVIWCLDPSGVAVDATFDASFSSH